MKKVDVVLGLQWGDEGKGKVVDVLTPAYQVIARFQGGPNAGHSLHFEDKKYVLHTIPSGIFREGSINIIGNGVALNIPKFLEELEHLRAGGVPEPHILISERTQVLMPYHVLQDQYEEERLAGHAFGSTKSGIAPFYSDKYAKYGIQVCELFDEKRLMERLEAVCEIKNVLFEHLYHKPRLDPKALFEELMGYRDQIAPHVGDAMLFVKEALAQGKEVLLEAQLGSMKDPDFGIYPFTTSSHTLAGFGCMGVGVAPQDIQSIVAVTKAYSSAVGAGAFVSELFGEEAEELRRRGGDAGEYGATTGRPRRVGWFDAVATRYGCMVQGATEVALTAVDCLGYLDEIKVCTGYEVDGKVTRDFPVTPLLERAKPVYTTLPGWKSDIRGETDYSRLPAETKGCGLPGAGDRGAHHPGLHRPGTP